VAPADNFHIVTTGTSGRMIRNLWRRIASGGGYRISHIVHPTYSRSSWDDIPGSGDIHFLRDRYDVALPPADPQLLASLEAYGPTIHNMILSDRCVSKLDYDDALRYATYLSRRLMALYEETKPSVVIGGFDALHGSLEMAVAKRMGIPWFALSFTVLPKGLAAFCSDLSPAAAVVFEPERHRDLRPYAEQRLSEFEEGALRAPAYVPPPLLSLSTLLRRLPSHASSMSTVLRRRADREALKYTDHVHSYSLRAQVREALRLRKNLWRLRSRALLTRPPRGRYAFFGLHMQPESSIDVFAQFFANQVRVIELMSRSLPPTHRLLVKLHKSDVPNYSPAWLDNIERLPGVQVVSAVADTFELIKGADVIFAITGTIALEAGLLGKPLILFGDSPTKVFPTASTVGRTVDLPELVRDKLAEHSPDRRLIVDAYARYLAPYYPASMNDWGVAPTDSEIDGYVRLFALLRDSIQRRSSGSDVAHAAAGEYPA
jgi:hypothetical protein